jgi:PIN domain nuclease of toxin-antitoxin system
MWSIDGMLPRHAEALVDAAAASGKLLLSPVSAWEIGTLVSKKRLRLNVAAGEYVHQLFVGTSAAIATLTPNIALASTMLPGDCHNDPMDRLLIATAAAYGAALMTRDKAIQAYAKKTKHIRCIAC